MISVQSKREITSSRMMASDCLLSKRESGRQWGEKGRSKSRAQTAKAGYAVSFEMHRTGCQACGQIKKQIQKGKTVLSIHNPDIIPDKLKADFSKRIRNTAKKVTSSRGMIYVATNQQQLSVGMFLIDIVLILWSSIDQSCLNPRSIFFNCRMHENHTTVMNKPSKLAIWPFEPSKFRNGVILG